MARKIMQFGFVVLGSACVTAFYSVVATSVNHTTVALTFLLIPLVAGTYGLIPGITASILCGFCFNFFFLPPVGTLIIRDPQNYVAFAVFVVTALTASHLSASARKRSQESERRREQLSKLYELSRIIISGPHAENAAAQLTQQIA